MEGTTDTRDRHWCEGCQSETHCKKADVDLFTGEMCYCTLCGRNKDGHHG